MSKKFALIFKEEANSDIAHAFNWYERQSTGLGYTFFTSLEATYKTLSGNPAIYQKVYKDFRQAIVSPFPFVILYKIEDAGVIIFRVFHTSQDPDKKF